MVGWPSGVCCRAVPKCTLGGVQQYSAPVMGEAAPNCDGARTHTSRVWRQAENPRANPEHTKFKVQLILWLQTRSKASYSICNLFLRVFTPLKTAADRKQPLPPFSSPVHKDIAHYAFVCL